MVKPCASDKIMNTVTNRCVSKTGKVGREFIGKRSPKKSSCPPDKVINPKTGRCVKKDGPIGRKILKSSPKKSSPKKSSFKHADLVSLPSLSDIGSSMPSNISLLSKDEDRYVIKNVDIQANVRDWYGPYATKFSYLLAKSFPVGTKVYALMGQNYGSLQYVTKKYRLKELTEFVVGGWDGKYLTIFERDKDNDIHDYEIYEYKNYMVSGSGADPIYVFVK